MSYQLKYPSSIGNFFNPQGNCLGHGHHFKSDQLQIHAKEWVTLVKCPSLVQSVAGRGHIQIKSLYTGAYCATSHVLYVTEFSQPLRNRHYHHRVEKRSQARQFNWLAYNHVKLNSSTFAKMWTLIKSKVNDLPENYLSDFCVIEGTEITSLCWLRLHMLILFYK